MKTQHLLSLFRGTELDICYLSGECSVQPLSLCCCVYVCVYAEVSCFDDVALLYHRLKQCNSIVMASGFGSTAEGHVFLLNSTAHRKQRGNGVCSMESRPLTLSTPLHTPSSHNPMTWVICGENTAEPHFVLLSFSFIILILI